MERMLSPSPLALATLAGVILCWLVFAGIFLLRKRTPQAPKAKRDSMATLGIALQMCAYFLVWFQPPGRPFLSPVAALSSLPGILFSVFTVTIAGGPAWLSENAVRTLSKQWALRAATRDVWDADRDRPSDGTLDRNAGGSLYFLGMVIRVRREEKLLRAAVSRRISDATGTNAAALQFVVTRPRSARE